MGVRRLIHTCDMIYSYVWHDSFMYVTWLIHTRDMTRPYVWQGLFTRVTWRVRMCDATHWYVWQDSFIWVTWLVHTCDMKAFIGVTRLIRDTTHSWHDSFILAMTWHFRTCYVTLSYVWHDPFTRVTLLIYMCDRTYSHVRHDAFARVTCLIYINVTGFIHVCNMTRSYVWRDSCAIQVIWRWVGDPQISMCILKLHFEFAFCDLYFLIWICILNLKSHFQFSIQQCAFWPMCRSSILTLSWRRWKRKFFAGFSTTLAR